MSPPGTVKFTMSADTPTDETPEGMTGVGAKYRASALVRVERRKQRGRPVAAIGMRVARGLARLHRQQGLCAVESLNLRFFIDTQHQGMIGRVEIHGGPAAVAGPVSGCVGRVLLRVAEAGDSGPPVGRSGRVGWGGAALAAPIEDAGGPRAPDLAADFGGRS